MNFVSHAVIANVDKWHATFNSAHPFKHIVLDNFFLPEVADSLLCDFPTCSEPSNLLNEFGNPNAKNVVTNVNGISEFYSHFDNYIASEGFLRLMSGITGIRDLSYDPFYYGGGTHENFHGAGLDAHIDFNLHPRTGYHRRLNAIIYLNKEWNPAWGGAICLHTDPWDLTGDQVTEIEPKFNRCVIFETSEVSWHSVTKVNVPGGSWGLSRKSFAIYNYTKERPPNEVAPSHGTVYVQAGLPSAVKPGTTLSQQDYADILRNLARRNQYSKTIFRRELKFSSVIAELQRQLGEERAQSNVPIMGHAKQLRVTNWLHPDGFAGRKLAFELQLARPVHGLRIKGFRPPGLHGEVEAKLIFGERHGSFIIKNGPFDWTWKFDTTEGSVPVEIAVDGASRLANSDDLRDLSFKLDFIELLHD